MILKKLKKLVDDDPMWGIVLIYWVGGGTALACMALGLWMSNR